MRPARQKVLQPRKRVLARPALRPDSGKVSRRSAKQLRSTSAQMCRPGADEEEEEEELPEFDFEKEPLLLFCPPSFSF